MSDLFGAARRASRPRVKPTRAEIVERFGVSDLKSPRAHLCFRCGASTGLGFGSLHRGTKIVFACKEHFGELQ
ncbi:hypothetical protein EDE12_103141 [Methylosinus sp. sav-2]|uniref:hypothetical protein n=1 Tax=Methylosinus sp. sav-2 TaxID=2485168 RepID=UPI0004796FDC|nr:hypothetical protein [Methylosinus sp. sav-2]TDX65169.1 hypothetical protein EDE12_103141 [Methylosinus sp. sav-2]